MTHLSSIFKFYKELGSFPKLPMAPSHSMNSAKLILLSLTIFSCLQHFCVLSFEFQVGGTDGWVVPPPNDTKLYNHWASENRFQVGDTLRFKYRKDSVMEVSEADYKKCNSSYPNMFSNTGNTVFNLNESGPFYFISGVSGHCERGQRMIIKVMTWEDSQAATSGATSSYANYYPPAAPLLSLFGVSKLALLHFLLSSLASYL